MKKLSLKKFDNFVGYSFVCFLYMITNIILIGLIIEIIKIDNIYISAVIASPIFTGVITQWLLKNIFQIENDKEQEKFEKNILHMYYSIHISYLLTFIICSLALKTTEFISLILLTVFMIFSNFSTPVKFEKHDMFKFFVKNDGNDAFVQRKINLVFVFIFTLALSINLIFFS